MSRIRPPQTFLQLVQKFLIKSSILMNAIYHKGRAFSKWINAFQCKTGPKDQHRKQKRQDINPAFVSFFIILFFY